MVHVTGAITGVSEVYEKDGQVQLRKRPQIMLDSKSAQLMLGAAPKQDTPQRAAAGTVVVKRVSVDNTPEIEPNLKLMSSVSPLADTYDPLCGGSIFYFL